MDHECWLHGLVRQEGDFWVALVLEVDVMGTGDTPEAAISMARDNAIAFVSEQVNLGTPIRRILSRHVPRRYWLTYYWLTLRGKKMPDHNQRARKATFQELAPLPC